MWIAFLGKAIGFLSVIILFLQKKNKIQRAAPAKAASAQAIEASGEGRAEITSWIIPNILNLQNDSNILPGQTRSSGLRGRHTIKVMEDSSSCIQSLSPRIYALLYKTSLILAHPFLANSPGTYRCLGFGWQVIEWAGSTRQVGEALAGVKSQQKRAVFAFSAIGLFCHLPPGRLPR